MGTTPHRERSRKVVYLLRATVWNLLIVVLIPPLLLAEEPRRWELETPIPILSSVAAVDAQTVFVTDAIHRKLYAIELDRSSRGTSSWPVAEISVDDPTRFPTVLHRATDDHSLLQISRHLSGAELRLHWNAEGDFEGGREIPPLTVEGGHRKVLGLYDFTVANQHLVGFGALDSSTGDFGHAALVSHSLRHDPSRSSEAGTVLMSLGNLDFYLLGYPTLATSQGASFFLHLDRMAELFRFEPEADVTPVPLGGLPYGDVELPLLTNGGTRNPLESLQFAESTSMPAGLYSDGELLFLLHRRPEAATPPLGTRWTLHALEPMEDRVRPVGVAELPSKAAHLRLMAHPDGGWLGFEQDSLELEHEDGRLAGWSLPTRTVLEIPKDWLSRQFFVSSTTDEAAKGVQSASIDLP